MLLDKKKKLPFMKDLKSSLTYIMGSPDICPNNICNIENILIKVNVTKNNGTTQELKNKYLEGYKKSSSVEVDFNFDTLKEEIIELNSFFSGKDCITIGCSEVQRILFLMDCMKGTIEQKPITILCRDDWTPELNIEYINALIQESERGNCYLIVIKDSPIFLSNDTFPRITALEIGQILSNSYCFIKQYSKADYHYIYKIVHTKNKEDEIVKAFEEEEAAKAEAEAEAEAAKEKAMINEELRRSGLSGLSDLSGLSGGGKTLYNKVKKKKLTGGGKPINFISFNQNKELQELKLDTETSETTENIDAILRKLPIFSKNPLKEIIHLFYLTKGIKLEGNTFSIEPHEYMYTLKDGNYHREMSQLSVIPISPYQLSISTKYSPSDNYIITKFLYQESLKHLLKETIVLQLIFPTDKSTSNPDVQGVQGVKEVLQVRKSHIFHKKADYVYLKTTLRKLLDLISDLKEKNVLISFLDIFDRTDPSDGQALFQHAEYEKTEYKLKAYTMRYWLLFYAGYIDSFQLINGGNIGV